MKYKKVLLIGLVFIMVFSITCQKSETGIKGTLILQTGQSGDVRNCRVQLFQTADLTGTPLKEVASDASGTDPTRSTFEITDVVPGYYYLRAWKDLNGNGKVDHLDIVGVYGGTYKAGYGGSQLTVQEGEMKDVGEIVMLIYKELELSLSASVDANNLLTITYSFNDDCTVTSFTLTIPTGETGKDDSQAGAKTANTTYTSSNWRYGNYEPWPTGTYTVTITGSYDGKAFTLTGTFNL